MRTVPLRQEGFTIMQHEVERLKNEIDHLSLDRGAMQYWRAKAFAANERVAYLEAQLESFDF